MNTTGSRTLPWTTTHALWAKEVRQLQPLFRLALLLAIVPVWILGWFSPQLLAGEGGLIASLPLWLGGLWLALSVFGREFGQGTFALLLTQPVPRTQVWRTKLVTAGAALAVCFAATAVSHGLWRWSQHPVGVQANPWVQDNGGWLWVGVTLLVVLATGVWTSLVFRQVLAAFWVALLVPVLWIQAIVLAGGRDGAIRGGLLVYVVLALAWSRRYFLTAQETGWTGAELGPDDLTRPSGRSRRAAAPLVTLYQLARGGMSLGEMGLVLLIAVGFASFSNGLLAALVVVAAGPWGGWLRGRVAWPRVTACALPIGLYALGTLILNYRAEQGAPELADAATGIWPRLLAAYAAAGWGLAGRERRAGRGVAAPPAGPTWGLLRNEFGQAQTALLGMLGLFTVHLGVLFLRRAVHPPGDTSLLGEVLTAFGGLWLLVPILAAAGLVAEERRQGTWAGRLCLPVSGRRQFAVKLAVAGGLYGVLPAGLLWLAEGLGAACGAGGGLGGLPLGLSGGQGLGTVLEWCVALAVAALYASSLAANLWQAVGLAVALVLGLLGAWLELERGVPRPGFRLWVPLLLHGIAEPGLLLVLVVLARANCAWAAPTTRLWWRNARSLAAAVAGLLLLTTGVYHRGWELIGPGEKPAGSWISTLPVGVPFAADAHAAILLPPDERMRLDRLAWSPGDLLVPAPWRGHGHLDSGTAHFSLFDGVRRPGRWIGQPERTLAPGTNWLSVAALEREACGVRGDGTLWVSSRTEYPWRWSRDQYPVANHPAPWVQYGDEKDWRQVAAVPGDETVVLRKADGTLWRWAGRTNGEFREEGLRAHPPRRLGTGTNWARLVPGGTDPLVGAGGLWLVQDQQGATWRLRSAGNNSRTWWFDFRWPSPPAPELVLEPDFALTRMPSLDGTTWRCLTPPGLGVRTDGTLWLAATAIPAGPNRTKAPYRLAPPRQIGTDTNWISVTWDGEHFAGLKEDGSLWRWHANFRGAIDETNLDRPPTRLGRRPDWVGLGVGPHGLVTLAADGGLWDWSGLDDWYGLLAASRHPRWMSNLLTEQSGE